MRITLSIGLALIALAALLTASYASAIEPQSVAGAADAGGDPPSAALAATPPYSVYLPLIMRPHPCWITPCLVRTEPFEDPAGGWPTHTLSLAEPVPPGPYGMQYTGLTYQIYYSPSLPFRVLASVSPITHPANTIIDVTARWTEFQWGNGYGVVFGADAPYTPTHLYAAIVSCLGVDECNWQHAIIWRIDNFQQGASHQPALPGQPPNPHQRTELTSSVVCTPCKNSFSKWNQVRIIRSGPSITLQVNGSTVLTATDSVYTGAGYAGLLVENWENNRPTTVEADHLTVYDLGP